MVYEASPSPLKGQHLGEAECGLDRTHPHLHGLFADGYWKDGVLTRFAEVDLKAIEDAFAERVLAQLHKQELNLQSGAPLDATHISELRRAFLTLFGCEVLATAGE